MADSVVRIDNHGAVRVVSMNRPDKLNALNTDLLLALRDALEAADQDDGVRALVLTGEGRGFSAGADLSEFRGEQTPEQVKRNALRSSLMSGLQVHAANLVEAGRCRRAWCCDRRRRGVCDLLRHGGGRHQPEVRLSGAEAST